MEKIERLSRQEVVNFIESDLDELDYFGCIRDRKDKLILFKQYVFDIKKRNEEYYRLAQKYIDSIKQKNNWVTDVVPNPKVNQTALWIEGKNNPGLPVGKNNPFDKNDPYVLKGTLIYCGIIRKIQIASRLKERTKILFNSGEELKEIGTIAKDLGCSELRGNTISSIFNYYLRDVFNDNGRVDLCHRKNGFIGINLLTGKIDEHPMLFEEERDYNPLSSNQRHKLLSKLYVRK